MVPACRRLRPMVQVYMVMEPAMECLMQDGAIHGFAEASASVLAEVSVGAGAEVAAEADWLIGGRFKLEGNCRKDRYYA